jgi:glycosyltransferase involved in cell wall biosynthesis
VKPVIVLSGVNCKEMGILSTFRDALSSLVTKYAEHYQIIALVHRKSLFDIPGVTFIEYPEIKSSWWKRLRFEYYDCRAFSNEVKPELWFAMHDMTPVVSSKLKAVYCHNPSPFYPFTLKAALLDWKFALFTLFYRYLYAINIRSNDFVVVQQDWIRREFRSRYGVKNVVVAHPSVSEIIFAEPVTQLESHRPFRFFYPAYPRVFKNIEQMLDAARMLGVSGFGGFEVWLTMNGEETPYAAKMRRKYSDLASVRWMGLLPRTEVMRLYLEADCLLFPSKLETWGMPITEFKATGKPILAANLPYAHETVGAYEKAAFFDVTNVEELADFMRKAVIGESVFGQVSGADIASPCSRNWEELWSILLPPSA